MRDRKTWAAAATAIVAALCIATSGSAAKTQSSLPKNTNPPTISGTPAVSKTLTGNRGTWSGSSLRFAYKWLRCNSAGTSCAGITGATGTTYTVGTADVGGTIKFSVAASNRGGSATATSSATAVVTAGPTGPPPPPPPGPTAPSNPSGLAASSVGATSLVLGWNASAGSDPAVGYDVYVNQSLATTTSGTSYTVGGLACGTTYSLAVDAYDALGAKSGQVSISVSTSACPSPSSTSVYWGAWIGKQFTGSEAPWSWTTVTDFEAANAGGKPISVLNWSSPWIDTSTGNPYPFQTSTFESVRQHGVIPFFSWANTGISDAAVASGQYDSYIRGWATAAKDWGHPFFLRYDWEMNGSWFNWGVGSGGTTPAQFVAAWQHVHDIFTSVGADNVSWVWCPNVDPGNKFANLASLYPGDSYVDWTCLDGYNKDTPWTSFTDLFASTYDQVTAIAPSKPMIVGEVGSTSDGGSKAQWISDMFAALPTRFPDIHGIVWFDKYGTTSAADWPIETSLTSSAAFALAINRQQYLPGTFSNLSNAP